MTVISASSVKDLREKTGAGMMECKKALTESGGDFEKAVDLLRQKGLASAVGRVKSVRLENYEAKVELLIDGKVAIQEDAIASIRTKGLIGEKFVQIMPGGSDKVIPPGGKIRETESAIDVEELISKYAFGKI